MVKCCVVECPSDSKKESTLTSNVTFHRFPKDPEKKKLWVKALDTDVCEIEPHTRICSRHFLDSCFYVSADGTRMLRVNVVVPTELLPEPLTNSDLEYDSADSEETREMKAEIIEKHKIIKRLRRKFKTLKQRNRRLKIIEKALERAVPVDDVLSELKSKRLINTEQFHHLSDLGSLLPFPFFMRKN